MLDEILYKEQLETLREYAKKKEYIPLQKIVEVFSNPSEELLDDVVEYLENMDIEVTRESDEVPDEEEIIDDEYY